MARDEALAAKLARDDLDAKVGLGVRGARGVAAVAGVLVGLVDDGEGRRAQRGLELPVGVWGGGGGGGEDVWGGGEGVRGGDAAGARARSGGVLV